MTLTTALSLLAGVAGASAFVSAPIGATHQKPFGLGSAGSDFSCDLPPVLSPTGDGLPSGESLFSSDEALLKQVERHQAIVQVPSICYDDLGDFDEDERWAPFYDVHDTLAETYPVIHKRMTLDKVNTFGLVYTINGSDPSLKPIFLAAHQDVVPVADVSTWTHPPFDAYFDGEWIWGRGSSDDKNSLTALMSAVETLLSNPDWTPSRTIILAFGFDEECSGYRGAAKIGSFLTDRYGDDGIALILDEGGLPMQLLGGDTLYVFPSVVEKGHVDVWASLHVVGGHSSIPAPHTGIGIAAEMVAALEANPYAPAVLRGSPVYNHLVCVARYSPDDAAEIADLLRAGDLEKLTAVFVDQGGDAARYMVQTSQAVDLIRGGQKINAMPEVVTLGVNYRVAPQDSIPAVQHNFVRYIEAVVEKYNISVKAYEGDEEYEAYVSGLGLDRRANADAGYDAVLVLQGREKSEGTPVSPTSGPIWDVFSGTIQHAFAFEGGKVVPVGEIMNGNTDTRHYLNLSPNVYRWTPSRQRGSENIHTIDERVRMDSHMDMVRFYYDLVRNFDGAEV
ncbi:putative carboxypeptidase C24C9.08 [Neonectria ditissima]|uniref:Putative carboxypeptidase C24C9.08 n=1 Tax=Neonectria ditissima TaxID=78410 RepID=A0A0P7AB64_9HYPO|nr:putative carboxypeptidase C24C9.08 [Neonectria ditissima]